MKGDLYMLKTNSKAVKTAIREYLSESFDFSGYDESFNDLSLQDKAKKFLEIMQSEWYNGYEAKRNPCLHNAVIEYLKGLPSGIHVAFYYSDERNLLKEWLQETEEEAQKYDDYEVDQLYWHLLSREILALAK